MDRYAAGLDRLLELTVLLNGDMTRSLARSGLTTSRAHVLWELRRQGPTVQRVLADSLGVTARTVTGLIDGLVATGFVTRQPHPTDRRATLVTLTGRGTATVEAMERDQREFVQILFGGMPDEQFTCLIAGVDEVLRRLRDQSLRVWSEITGESR